MVNDKQLKININKWWNRFRPLTKEESYIQGIIEEGFDDKFGISTDVS